MDDAEVMFSANVGEPPKALASVASGGEISRVMLAIKAVLRIATESQLSCLTRSMWASEGRLHTQ